MKAIFYSLMTILLFSAATCRRTHSSSSLDKQLIGAWKYTKRGGYAGKSENPDPTINHVLEFKIRFNYIKKNGYVLKTKLFLSHHFKYNSRPKKCPGNWKLWNKIL